MIKKVENNHQNPLKLFGTFGFGKKNLFTKTRLSRHVEMCQLFFHCILKNSSNIFRRAASRMTKASLICPFQMATFQVLVTFTRAIPDSSVWN